jgi:hypothetical protein
MSARAHIFFLRCLGKLRPALSPMPVVPTCRAHVTPAGIGPRWLWFGVFSASLASPVAAATDSCTCTIWFSSLCRFPPDRHFISESHSLPSLALSSFGLRGLTFTPCVGRRVPGPRPSFLIHSALIPPVPSPRQRALAPAGSDSSLHSALLLILPLFVGCPCVSYLPLLFPLEPLSRAAMPTRWFAA